MTQAGSDDAILAELVARLTERVRCGEDPDISNAVKEHPHLERELKELLGAALLADQIGLSTCHQDRESTVHPSGIHKIPGRIGEFEVIEEIGRGGMGVVFLAKEASLDREVALKTIISGELASDSDLARFRAEAEAAAQLDHPNIVPVYSVGEWEARPFFCMKYIPGQTLSQRLASGPLDSRKAATILLPIAQAIQFAHDKGVLHRDIKPSNILLDADDSPHIADFGLAKRIDHAESLTRSGAMIGTPGYMAPEQATEGWGEVGVATDVYGLGAVLYHMVTGRPPFQSASPIDTLFLMMEQDPLPPRLVNPRVDRDLELIVLKCLQKPTDLRYRSAGALARDLDCFLEGESISARAAGVVSVVSRALRETHHAGVLENWGLLWMWHSVVLLVLCLTTNLLHWRGFSSPIPYLVLWSGGIAVWAPIFMALRYRSGPVTFVERQIVHVWAASVVANILLYGVEILLELDVLTLSPVLALTSGMVFMTKAGILSGRFYFQATALFFTAIPMAIWPQWGQTIFGIVSAVCFFLPGWKYYRRSLR